MSAYSKVLDLESAQSFDRAALLQEAEGMLGDYGAPIHYLTIAYNYWENGDLKSALRVAEAGYANFHELSDGDDEEDYRSILGLKNSIAYYLADFGDTAQKDRAHRLIAEAADYWKKRLDAADEERKLAQKSYTNFLDTQGYVNIRFSDSLAKLEEGYAQCKQARRMGIEEKLFIRHTKAYHKRMGELLEDLD